MRSAISAMIITPTATALVAKITTACSIAQASPAVTVAPTAAPVTTKPAGLTSAAIPRLKAATALTATITRNRFFKTRIPFFQERPPALLLLELFELLELLELLEEEDTDDAGMKNKIAYIDFAIQRKKLIWYHLYPMTKPFRTHHLIQALEDFSQQALPLDLFLNQYYRNNKALGSKDRLFIGETIYSMIRWQGLLDGLLPAPHGWKERLDMFQSAPLPDLRATSGLKDYQKVSFPEWLFNKLKEQWGEKSEEICLISNQKAPATVRVNLMKTDRTTLLNTLKKYSPVELTTVSPWGIVFKEKVNYFEIPEFRSGHFEVQDEGSQLIADLVNPHPQDHVLDFCAGSGGKTLAFAYKMGGKGQIYLHDIRPKVLLQAKKRLRKAGIQNVQLIPAQDSRLKKLKGKMQIVLVDAPCSGTGTFRRHPEMKWKLTEATVARLVEQQRLIFEEALEYLAPNGLIIYATCSILHEENGAQTEHFVKTHHLEIVGAPLQIFPQENGADGFYGVTLKRT